MDYVLIATIRDSKDIVRGFRLLDCEKWQRKDVTYDEVYNVLKNKDIAIKGLGIKGSEIVGNNGSLSRYTKIYSRRVINKKLVIVKQLVNNGKNIGYIVSDYMGDVKKVTKDYLIQVVSETGIANGVVKELRGKKVLSSISGGYDLKELKETVGGDDIENTIWSREDFEKYMRDNKYDYKINDVEERIMFNCTKAKIIKYPLGIDAVSELGMDNSDAEVLILSPSIKRVSDHVMGKLPKLKKVVIQEGATDVTIRFHKNNKLEQLLLPSTLKSLKGKYDAITKEGFEIRSVDLSDTSLEKIDRMYNYCNNLEKAKLGDSMIEIYNSFNDCKSLKDIDYGKRVTSIRKSFNNLGIDKLDLRKFTNLDVIDENSFKECDNLKEVILGDNISELVGDSFCNCKALSRVELGKGIRHIGDYVFFGCDNLKEIEVTSKIKKIDELAFNREMKIKFIGDTNKINSELYNGSEYKIELEIGEGIKQIGYRAFYSNCMKSLKLPESLEVIDSQAFGRSRMITTLNMGNCKNLKVIKEGAFNTCNRLKNVILPDGLEVLESGVFADCFENMFVYLPNTIIKMDGAFDLDYKNITFLVYKGSLGHKMCIEHNMRFIIVNSIDDAYRYTGVNREISDKKKLKMKLLLGSSKDYSSLLDEGYIDSADRIYNIVKYIRSDKDLNNTEEVLDTSKYRDTEMCSKYKPEMSAGISEDTNIYTRDSMSSRFIIYSNIITSLLDYDDRLLDKTFIENCDIAYSSRLYVDNIASIDQVKVEDRSSRKAMNIIIISIADRMKFITGIDGYYGNENVRNKIEDSKNIGSNLIRMISKRAITENSIGELLNIGDIISVHGLARSNKGDNIIDGVAIFPPAFATQLHYSIRNSIKELVVYENADKNRRVTGTIINDSDEVNDSIMIDVDRGYVFRCKRRAFSNSRADALIKHKCKLKDISESELESMRELVKKDNVKLIIDLCTNSIENIKYDPKYEYDTDICKEVEIAMSLNSNSDISKALTQTDLVEVVNGRKKYRKNEFITSGNGRFPSYESRFSLERLKNIMKELTYDSSMTKGIDDKLISVEDIERDYTVLSNKTIQGRYSIMTTICRDGCPYTLIGNIKKGYYKLFRYKTVGYMLESTDKLVNDESTITELIECYGLIGKGKKASLNRYYNTREVIKIGIQDNVYLKGIDVELIDKLAKQSK